MKMENYCVVGIGELLWDLLPDGKQVGGAPANFAYHAQVLGANSHIVSAVCNDSLGQELLAQLQERGMRTDFIALEPEHPTGTVGVKLDDHGKPDFIIHQDVAWDYFTFTDEQRKLASATDAVSYGTLAQRMPVSRSAIYAFVRATPPHCLRIYDINLRQFYFNKRIIEETLHFSTILKLNEVELGVLAGLFCLTGSEKEVLLQLLELFELRLVAVTKGEKGSTLITLEEESHLTTPPINIVDTVGAGDAFTAALAMGLLRGQPLDKIHRQAIRLAAYVCTQKGAMPPISLAKLDEIMMA